MTDQSPPLEPVSHGAAPPPLTAAPAAPMADDEPMIAVGEPPVFLTLAQHEALVKASRLYKPIRKAMGIASFDAFATAMLAILALPFVFFSPWLLIAVVVLTIVTIMEVRGKVLLGRLNPAASRWLGWNQLFFLTMIGVYCGASIVWTLLYPPDLSAAQELSHLLPAGYQNTDWTKVLQIATVVIYGLVALTSAIYIGLVALYYFTRRAHILRFIDEAPAWVVAMYRMNAGAMARAVRRG